MSDPANDTERTEDKLRVLLLLIGLISAEYVSFTKQI